MVRTGEGMKQLRRRTLEFGVNLVVAEPSDTNDLYTC